MSLAYNPEFATQEHFVLNWAIYKGTGNLVVLGVTQFRSLYGDREDESSKTLLHSCIKSPDGGEGGKTYHMYTRYETYTQHLADAVLDSPGETDPALRHAVQEQSARLSGRPSQLVGQIPPELVTYVKKVALHAYKITDEDIEALCRAGYSEDAIFELTLSAAFGAGMARLERGLSALKGGRDATQED